MNDDISARMRLCAWGYLLFYSAVFAIIIIYVGSLLPRITFEPTFNFNPNFDLFKFGFSHGPTRTVDQVLPSLWPIPMLLVTDRKTHRLPLIFLYIGAWLCFGIGLASSEFLRTHQFTSFQNVFVIYPCLLGIESYILHKLLEPLRSQIGASLRNGDLRNQTRTHILEVLTKLEDQNQKLKIHIQKLEQQQKERSEQKYQVEYLENFFYRFCRLILHPIVAVTTKPGTSQRDALIKFLDWQISSQVHKNHESICFIINVLRGFPFSLLAQGILDRTVYLRLPAGERLTIFEKYIPIPYSKRIRLSKGADQCTAIVDLYWFVDGAWDSVKYEISGLSELKGPMPIVQVTAKIDKNKNIVVHADQPLFSKRIE